MSIQTFPTLLSQNECNELETYIDNFGKLSFMGNNPHVENFFIEKIFPRLPVSLKSCQIVSWDISDNVVPFHIDGAINDDTHKLLIYLSEGPGTDFCRATGVIVHTVPGNLGTGVLFDLCMHHKGCNNLTTIKKTCGLRVKHC